MPKEDAWKQEHDLLVKFTKSWEVRKDIRVTGLGCDRGVELVIVERTLGEWDLPVLHSTGRRNVGTMRELAAAIVAACDFVDESNPTWAAKR